MGLRSGMVAAAATLVLAGCGSGAATESAGSAAEDTPPPAAASVSAPAPAEDPERPVILATTSIWADVVANVACDGLAEVDSLIPVGGDSHTAELSMADRGRMDEATAIVANGLLLEERLEDTINTVEASGVPVFRMADHVEAIPFGEDGHAHDDEAAKDDHDHAHDHDHAEDEAAADETATEDDHGHSHDGDDPHIWFDPTRVSAALPALGDFLVAEGGLDRSAVDACVAAYQDALSEADAEVEATLAAIPDDRRKLVTNHDSLSYFADRYGFEVIGTVIPSSSTLAQTSPAQLEELAQVIADAGVSAVFAESQHSLDEIQTLADRVGEVDVVTLYTDSLGEPGSGADTYIGMLRTDATLIADALG